MKIFTERLIALRKEQGMTQEGLAKLIGKTRSAVSGYETEYKEPDFTLLCFLADYFGVTTDFLLGRDNSRTHSDVVFYNDTQNLKKHFENLSEPLNQTVAALYDAFYLLISRDVQLQNDERLELYCKLFSLLQDSRAKIRNTVESCGGEIQDALLLSELMSMQNSLKSDISSCLDNLLQADINTAFGVKKVTQNTSEKIAT